jgi:hypothetical protein
MLSNDFVGQYCKISLTSSQMLYNLPDSCLLTLTNDQNGTSLNLNFDNPSATLFNRQLKSVNHVPGAFLLTLNKPVVMCTKTLEYMQSVLNTEIHSQIKKSSFLQLLVKQQPNSGGGKFSYDTAYSVQLPDETQIFYVSEESFMSGCTIEKIPFTHPQDLCLVLDLIRKQLLLNELIISCMKKRSSSASTTTTTTTSSNKQNNNNILYPNLNQNDMSNNNLVRIIELSLMSPFSLSIVLQHPIQMCYTTIEFDITSSTHSETRFVDHFDLHPSPNLISQVLIKCHSIPVTLRALLMRYKNKDFAKSELAKFTFNNNNNNSDGGGGDNSNDGKSNHNNEKNVNNGDFFREEASKSEPNRTNHDSSMNMNHNSLTISATTITTTSSTKIQIKSNNKPPQLKTQLSLDSSSLTPNSNTPILGSSSKKRKVSTSSTSSNSSSSGSTTSSSTESLNIKSSEIKTAKPNKTTSNSYNNNNNNSVTNNPAKRKPTNNNNLDLKRTNSLSESHHDILNKDNKLSSSSSSSLSGSESSSNNKNSKLNNNNSKMKQSISSNDLLKLSSKSSGNKTPNNSNNSITKSDSISKKLSDLPSTKSKDSSNLNSSVKNLKKSQNSPQNHMTSNKSKTSLSSSTTTPKNNSDSIKTKKNIIKSSPKLMNLSATELIMKQNHSLTSLNTSAHNMNSSADSCSSLNQLTLNNKNTNLKSDRTPSPITTQSLNSTPDDIKSSSSSMVPKYEPNKKESKESKKQQLPPNKPLSTPLSLSNSSSSNISTKPHTPPLTTKSSLALSSIGLGFGSGVSLSNFKIPHKPKKETTPSTPSSDTSSSSNNNNNNDEDDLAANSKNPLSSSSPITTSYKTLLNSPSKTNSSQNLNSNKIGTSKWQSMPTSNNNNNNNNNTNRPLLNRQLSSGSNQSSIINSNSSSGSGRSMNSIPSGRKSGSGALLPLPVQPQQNIKQTASTTNITIPSLMSINNAPPPPSKSIPLMASSSIVSPSSPVQHVIDTAMIHQPVNIPVDAIEPVEPQEPDSPQAELPPIVVPKLIPLERSGFSNEPKKELNNNHIMNHKPIVEHHAALLDVDDREIQNEEHLEEEEDYGYNLVIDANPVNNTQSPIKNQFTNKSIFNTATFYPTNPTTTQSSNLNNSPPNSVKNSITNSAGSSSLSNRKNSPLILEEDLEPLVG